MALQICKGSVKCDDAFIQNINEKYERELTDAKATISKLKNDGNHDSTEMLDALEKCNNIGTSKILLSNVVDLIAQEKRTFAVYEKACNMKYDEFKEIKTKEVEEFARNTSQTQIQQQNIQVSNVVPNKVESPKVESSRPQQQYGMQ
jgi:hypothetical protein